MKQSRSGIVPIRIKISKILHKNTKLFFKIKYWRLRAIMWIYSNVDDRTFIEKQYHRRTGKLLNLESPVLYNEKVQYRKLYDHDSRMEKLVDKAEVREYVKACIGEQYLPNLYGIYNTVEEIPFERLPDAFAIKLTNGSGFNYICKNKTPLAIKEIKRRFHEWLKLDYYMLGREWAYKNVKNRIICEEYLHDRRNEGLLDYKVFCFNGEPRMIQVDIDRFTNHKRNLYTIDWKLMQECMTYENDPDANIPVPDNLEEILWCARKLSSGFSHVRVDFYDIDGRIILGEMSFYPDAGYLKFNNEAFERQLGDYWEL